MLNVLFVNTARMFRIVVGAYNRYFSTTPELTVKMSSPTLLKWMTKKDRSFDVAQDDSGAVNSPSTSLHYAWDFHYGKASLALPTSLFIRYSQ